MQGKLNWPWKILFFNLYCNLNVYYHKYVVVFLQMSIGRLWQASITFDSRVHVFSFILVAFVMKKIITCHFFCINALT